MSDLTGELNEGLTKEFNEGLTEVEKAAEALVNSIKDTFTPGSETIDELVNKLKFDDFYLNNIVTSECDPFTANLLVLYKLYYKEILLDYQRESALKILSPLIKLLSCSRFIKKTNWITIHSKDSTFKEMNDIDKFPKSLNEYIQTLNTKVPDVLPNDTEEIIDLKIKKALEEGNIIGKYTNDFRRFIESIGFETTNQTIDWFDDICSFIQNDEYFKYDIDTILTTQENLMILRQIKDSPNVSKIYLYNLLINKSTTPQIINFILEYIFDYEKKLVEAKEEYLKKNEEIPPDDSLYDSLITAEDYIIYNQDWIQYYMKQFNKKYKIWSNRDNSLIQEGLKELREKQQQYAAKLKMEKQEKQQAEQKEEAVKLDLKKTISYLEETNQGKNKERRDKKKEQREEEKKKCNLLYAEDAKLNSWPPGPKFKIEGLILDKKLFPNMINITLPDVEEPINLKFVAMWYEISDYEEFLDDNIRIYEYSRYWPRSSDVGILFFIKFCLEDDGINGKWKILYIKTDNPDRFKIDKCDHYVPLFVSDEKCLKEEAMSRLLIHEVLMKRAENVLPKDDSLRYIKLKTYIEN
jgi:hypothetical protein